MKNGFYEKSKKYETIVSHLFFDVVQLLLELLHVSICGILVAIVHHGVGHGSHVGSTGHIGLFCGRLTAHGPASGLGDIAGLVLILVTDLCTAADVEGHGVLDSSPALHALLHDGGARLACDHVVAWLEQNARRIFAANQTIFNLKQIIIALVTRYI